MTSLLAFGIVISFILFFPVDSLKITVNTSQKLENYLCNDQSLSSPDVIFELNSSNYIISSGNFCIVSKFTNVTLQTNNPKTATITCIKDDYHHPTRGLAFINCTVTFQRVIFVNCGTYLPDNFTGFLNSSSLYYTYTHAAALLFIQCEVHMREVALNSSYGFAVIGINLIDSVLCKVNVSSSLSTDVYRNNNKIIGSGVLLHFLDIPYSLNTRIAINDAIFLDNIDVFNGSCITDVYYSSVQSKKPFHVVHAAGLTILYTQHHFKANVLIERTNFSNNIGSSSGALLILHYNTSLDSSTIIDNSKFKRNANWLYCHGAALQFYWFASNTFDNNTKCHPLVVTNTQFTKHLGIIEDTDVHNQSTGAVYIGIVNPTQISLTIKFKNSTFYKNKVAYTGACVFASVYENVGSVGDVTITLENITADQNSQDILYHLVSNAGMFSFYGIHKVIIKGNNNFTRNYGSVIYAVVSNVHLHDKIVFKENQGRKGAAIRLEGYCYLYLKKGLNATFISNKVQLSGGAIYANSVFHTPKGGCTIQIETGSFHNGTKLTFVNNEATTSGNSIFVTSMFYCYIDEGVYANPKHALTIYTKYFAFHHNHHNHHNNTLLNISTDPVHLSLYYDNGTQIHKGVIVNKYPGETFTIRLAAVDAAERYVYSTIEVAVACKQSSKNYSNYLWLSREQYETKILESSSNTSTPINITIHTKSNNTVDGILIFSLPLYPVANILHFNLRPCPLGFTLNKKSGNCECSKALGQLKKSHPHSEMNIRCSITKQTITRPLFETNSWMGPMEVKDNLAFGISLACPLGYCVSDPSYNLIRINVTSSFLTNGSTNTNQPLCLYNREGALCGKCKDINGHQYGTVFGSTECKDCSNLWLLTILLYIFLGLLFVYLLYAVRLTLTTGTLNGIILYAQAANGGLITAMKEYYGTKNILRQLGVSFLSFLNLNLGFPLCFYDGMTELWKAGLSLVFPIYLLTIAVILIILSRYSTWLSNRIARSSVQVLVTVVHLSFSNLLLTIIDVFTSSIIYTSDKHYHVWYRDGTVEYMGQSHCILVIISLVLTLSFILPYIIFLFCAKPLIQHYSLASNYLRPVFEAIHAPYKEGKHHWFVARLLLLITIYILYVTVNGNVLYIVTASLLASFLISQALFQPFKNKLISLLDNWLLLNLAVVYVNLWHINLQKATLFNTVAVFLVFMTFLSILLYHILWVTGLLIKIRRGVVTCRKWISDHILFYQNNRQSRVQHNQPLQDTDSFYGSCSQYREPILGASN